MQRFCGPPEALLLGRLDEALQTLNCDVELADLPGASGPPNHGCDGDNHRLQSGGTEMALIEICIFAALALAAAGTVIWVVAFVSSGIRREERDHSLLTTTPDRVARGARRLTGVYVRLPEPHGKATAG
jgi:hypothetical protein